MSDVIIRPIRAEDWQDHWEFRTRPNVVWGTLQIPTLPLEVVKMQSGAQLNNYVFVAEVDGKAVGSCGLHGGGNLRARHAIGLGMSVHDDYQGRGIGRKLMAAALDCADNYLGLERVDLEVYPDNERAVNLYKSFGFEAEGIYRGDAFRDGEFVDSLQMGRLRGRAAAAAARTPGAPGSAGGPGSTGGPGPAGQPKGITPADLAIRPVRPEDAPALHHIFLQPGALAHLNRIPALHLDDIRKETSGLQRGQHMVVAETGGQVVGAAYLTQWHPGRKGHCGTFQWIAVDEDWQGRGIGSALTAWLINLNERWLNLKRLDLHVPADDASALGLFRKFGFETEAVLRAAFFRGGQFVDVCSMARVGKLPA